MTSLTSPPVLPVPRQPSPLSFSSITVPNDDEMPLRSALGENQASSFRIPPARPAGPSRTTTTASGATFSALPTQSGPDSLLLRSTFAALEHSASTLKTLSKSVLNAVSAYTNVLEQLEKSEDELYGVLGELGRWLEGGYDVHDTGLWDPEGGVRKLRRQARRQEKEELEVMLEHSLRAIRAEIKRNGIAGGPAQGKFDQTAKQYYQQTSAYLSPQAGNSVTPSDPESTPMGVTPSSSSRQTSTDLAQASRSAQFDLARYSYHSTLMYAVPPTSISCLDLLVNLYTWVGSRSFQGSGQDLTIDLSLSKESSQASGISQLAKDDSFEVIKSPSQAQGSDPSLPKSSSRKVKGSLSSSLAQCAATRSELLQAWAARDAQTTYLEDAVVSKSHENGFVMIGSGISSADVAPLPVSSKGIENQKSRKMHRLHRSVGGRLRDLISSSGSKMSLSDVAADRNVRMSFDGGAPSNKHQSQDSQLPDRIAGLHMEEFSIPSRPHSQPSGDSTRDDESIDGTQLGSRISIAGSSGGSRFVEGPSSAPKPFESTPDLRSDLERLGGVGGLGSGGDEDERRQEVGRNMEGVLWGSASWEGLSKTLGKTKFEKLWVVLDRSRVYEYRDSSVGKPESAHAVIDLKFASVREGRGTDRRFVFEIVTPTQGRRVYQATSDHEMKQWLYAICNAIESCINGISSVRSIDTDKLRSPSGSLDDHALPTRRDLDIPGPRTNGLGLPMSSIPGSPATRRSMPPPSRGSVDTGVAQMSAVPIRHRQASFKKKMRQSAEIASEKWSHVMNGRPSPTVDFSQPAPWSKRRSSGMYANNSEEIPRKSSWTEQVAPDQPVPATQGKTGGAPPDGDIEKRVMQMAGVGLGISTSGTPSRRPHSSGAEGSTSANGGNDVTGTSNHGSAVKEGNPDMKMLRSIASLPSNTRCADCGKTMKSSRWATLSLRNAPMVVFLCIRCCGIHRGLGTHISKPRSVDLDIWTPESILLAKEWGNERGNAIWEKDKPHDLVPTDESIAEYVRSKYVEGKWLSEEDRMTFGLEPSGPVGRAL